MLWAAAVASVIAWTIASVPRADEDPSRTDPGTAVDARASNGGFAALRKAMRQPRARFAILAIIIGHMIMTSVMVMTPVSMNNEGMSLTLVGIVISVHVVGMYAASPLFGWLADKIGAARVVWIGVGIYVCSLGLGAGDAAFGKGALAPLLVALCLLGLGWSACLIGGSALLVESVGPAGRVSLQGVTDSAMNLGAAALAALAGPVLAVSGFLGVNLMAAVVLVVLVGAGWLAARYPDRTV